jgi:hypothetical protein
VLQRWAGQTENLRTERVLTGTTFGDSHIHHQTETCPELSVTDSLSVLTPLLK